MSRWYTLRDRIHSENLTWLTQITLMLLEVLSYFMESRERLDFSSLSEQAAATTLVPSTEKRRDANIEFAILSIFPARSSNGDDGGCEWKRSFGRWHFGLVVFNSLVLGGFKIVPHFFFFFFCFFFWQLMHGRIFFNPLCFGEKDAFRWISFKTSVAWWDYLYPTL